MKTLPNNSRVVLAAAVLTVLFATGCERRADTDPATSSTPPAESPAMAPSMTPSAPPETVPADPAPVTPAEVSNAANPNGQMAGSVVDDTVITTKVKTALLADSDVKGLDVNVDTAMGIVTLNGAVNNQTQIDRAGKLATDVAGVKSVTNNLTIIK